MTFCECLPCVADLSRTEEERNQYYSEKRLRWGAVKYEAFTLGSFLLVLYVCYGLIYWGFLSAALKVRGHDWWDLPNECINIGSESDYTDLILETFPGLVVSSDGQFEGLSAALLEIQSDIKANSVTGSHLCDSQEFNTMVSEVVLEEGVTPAPWPNGCPEANQGCLFPNNEFPMVPPPAKL